MIIQYEKTYQGAHKFYCSVNDQLITQQYFFYTKKAALQAFKQLIQDLGAGNV